MADKRFLAPGHEQGVVELRGVASVEQLVAAVNRRVVRHRQRGKGDAEVLVLCCDLRSDENPFGSCKLQPSSFFIELVYLASSTCNLFWLRFHDIAIL